MKLVLLLPLLCGVAFADEAKKEKPQIAEPPVTIKAAWLGKLPYGTQGLAITFVPSRPIYGFSFNLTWQDKEGKVVSAPANVRPKPTTGGGFGQRDPCQPGVKQTSFFTLTWAPLAVSVQCRITDLQVPDPQSGEWRRLHLEKDRQILFEAKPKTESNSAQISPRKE